MERRRFIAIATVTVGSTAGCLGSGGLTEDTGEVTTDRIIEDLPEVSWNEKQLSGEKFELSVTVTFNDADTVILKTMNSTVYTFNSENGQKQTAKVAGRNTEFGPIELGTIVKSYTEGESVAFGTYTIGMQQDVNQ